MKHHAKQDLRLAPQHNRGPRCGGPSANNRPRIVIIDRRQDAQHDKSHNKAHNAIEDGYYWGRFNVRLSGKHFMFRIIERMMNMRSCITGVATGDQAIFVGLESIEIVGTYPQLPLMEDVVFSKRLRNLGWPACIKQQVVTSSRRWEDKGILRTMLLMWRLRLLFFLGVSADKLARQYQ